MTARHPTLRLAVATLTLVVAATLVSGCVPYSSKTQYVLHQKAYVQAPRGPTATGPLAQKGDIALEGGGYGAVRAGEKESRLDGAPGHIVLDRGLNSRLVVGGLDRLEFGIGGSFGHSAFASSAASDLERSDTNFVSGSVDTHVRFRFVQTESVRLYALGELRTAIVPFRRRIDVYEQTTYHAEDGDTQSASHRERNNGYKNRLLLQPAAGLGATIFLSRNSFVSIGGYGQDMPVFFGRKVTVENCNNETGEIGDEQCQGREPSDVSPANRTIVGTAFGGFGVRIDKTTLKFQGFFNALSKSRWNEQVPGGGRLTVRYTF